MNCLGEQGEAGEEVVVAVGGIDVEVDRFGRREAVARQAQLTPAFVVDGHGRGMCLVEFEATAVEQREELVGQARLGGAREGEGRDALRSELADEHGGQAGAQAGRVDHQGADVPVFDEGKRGGVLIEVRAACPPLLVRHLDAGQIEFVEMHAPDGEDAAIAFATSIAPIASIAPILRRSGRFAGHVSGWPLFARHIHTADIPVSRARLIFPGMAPLQHG